MTDEPTKLPSVPEDKDKQASVTQLLEDVKKKYDRLKRNRQAVAFCSAKIPMEEKLLENAMKLVEEYSGDVLRLSKGIAEKKKRLDFALTYCKEHDEDHQKVKAAEDLAKKIERLQNKIIERKAALVEAMSATEG